MRTSYSPTNGVARTSSIFSNFGKRSASAWRICASCAVALRLRARAVAPAVGGAAGGGGGARGDGRGGGGGGGGCLLVFLDKSAAPPPRGGGRGVGTPRCGP